MDPGQQTLSSTVGRTCGACGENNTDSARFCSHCGEALRAIVASNGSAPAGNLDVARRHLALGAWEEAAIAAEAALLNSPNSAEAHSILGRARLRQGMRSLAIVHAEQAVALEPNNSEYLSDLVLARGDGETTEPRSRVPFIVATVAALLIVVLFFVAARPKDPVLAPPPQRQGPALTPSSQPFDTRNPQPVRALGIPTGRPRLTSPPRTAAAPPGPVRTQPTVTDTNTAPPVPGPAYPAPGASTLAPASVDSALRSFEPPVVARSTPVLPRQNLTQAPPPPQPGGTVFGGANFNTPWSNKPPVPLLGEGPKPAEKAADSGDTASSQTPISPQQQYVERDYGGAIQGYRQQVQNGAATGANYQQLGLAYERAGKFQDAADAYRQALTAYAAQIKAGQDVDVATRGTRYCQRALQVLQSR